MTIYTGYIYVDVDWQSQTYIDEEPVGLGQIECLGHRKAVCQLKSGVICV